VEIAKFILTAVGTFISVSALTFTIFQFWAKRRDEKDAAFKNSVRDNLKTEREQSLVEIRQERDERKESIDRLSKKVDRLEMSIMQTIQNRIGNIEGELKGMRGVLNSIQNWFVTNTPGGK
jgi:metal-responsive CopG/Arc/MetJ family transcriptional regulator